MSNFFLFKTVFGIVPFTVTEIYCRQCFRSYPRNYLRIQDLLILGVTLQLRSDCYNHFVDPPEQPGFHAVLYYPLDLYGQLRTRLDAYKLSQHTRLR